jgi:hypothetical protein
VRFAWVLLAVLVACLAACGGSDGGAPLRILVIGGVDPDVPDVQAKLAAFGIFETVDGFDGQAVTPSLAVLQDYDAVLVMSYAAFADPVAMGNALADYVDRGGGVVLTMFTLLSSFGLDGRFQSDNYFAIQETANQVAGDGPVGMIVHDAGHPILSGVSTFDGGTASFRPLSPGLHASAHVVAGWLDGVVTSTPLVVTRTAGTNAARRVDLGFYPATTDTGSSQYVDPASDALRIVANALRWAARDL